MIQAQVEGVGTLEFPDGTDPAVIQRTVKQMVSQQSSKPTTDYSEFVAEQRRSKEPERVKIAAKAEGQKRLKEAEAKVEANPPSTPLSTALDVASGGIDHLYHNMLTQALPDVVKKGLKAFKDSGLDILKASFEPELVNKAMTAPSTGHLFTDVGRMGVAATIDYTRGLLSGALSIPGVVIESPLAALQAMEVISPKTHEEILNLGNALLGPLGTGEIGLPYGIGSKFTKAAKSLQAAEKVVGTDTKPPDPAMDIPGFEQFRQENPRGATVIENLRKHDTENVKRAGEQQTLEQRSPQPIQKQYGKARKAERQSQAQERAATLQREESDAVLRLTAEGAVISQSPEALALLNRDLSKGATKLDSAIIPQTDPLMQKQVKGEPVTGEDLIFNAFEKELQAKSEADPVVKKSLIAQGQHLRKTAFARAIPDSFRDGNPLEWAKMRRQGYGITDPVQTPPQPVQTGKVLKHDEPMPERMPEQPSVAEPPKANAPTEAELARAEQLVDDYITGLYGDKLSKAKRRQYRMELDPVFQRILAQEASHEPSPNLPLVAVETPRSVGGVTVQEASALEGQTKTNIAKGMDVESAQKLAKSEAMLKQKQEEVQQLQQEKAKIQERVKQSQQTSPKRKGASDDVEQIAREAAQHMERIGKKLQEPNIVVNNPDDLKPYQPTREMREAEQVFRDATDTTATQPSMNDLAKTAMSSRFRVELVDAKQPTQAVRVNDLSNGTFADFKTIQEAHKYLRDNGATDAEGLDVLLRKERGQEKTLHEQVWGEKPAEKFGESTVGAARGIQKPRERQTIGERKDPLEVSRAAEEAERAAIQEGARIRREEIEGVTEGPVIPREMTFINKILDDANLLYDTGVPQVYTKAKELYETYQIKMFQGVRDELNKLDLNIPWRYRLRGDKAFFSKEFKEVGDALQAKTPIEKIRPALQPLARAALKTGRDLAEYERIPFEYLMEGYFTQQAEMPNFVRVGKAIDGKIRFADLSLRDQQAFQHAERIAQELQVNREAGLYIYQQTHFGRGRPPDVSPYLRGRTGAIPAKDHYRAFKARIEFSARKLYLEPALEKSFYLMQGYPESTKMIVGRHWDSIMGVPTDAQVLLRNSTRKLLTEATGGRYKATGREIEDVARFMEKMTAYNFVGLSPTAILKHTASDHFNIWAQFGTRWWVKGVQLRRSAKMQAFARDQLKIAPVPEAAYEGLAPDVRSQLEKDLGGQASARLFFGAYNWRNQVQREVAGLTAWSKAQHYGTQLPEVKYWMEHYGISKEQAAIWYGRLGANRGVKKLTTFDVPLILQESPGGIPIGRLLGQFGTRKLQVVENVTRAFSGAVRNRNYGPISRYIAGAALFNGLPFDEDLKIDKVAGKIGEGLGYAVRMTTGLNINRIPIYNLGAAFGHGLDTLTDHLLGLPLAIIFDKTPRRVKDLLDPSFYRNPITSPPFIGPPTQLFRALKNGTDWKRMILDAYEAIGPGGSEVKNIGRTAQELRTGQEREGVRGRLVGPISPEDAIAKHFFRGSAGLQEEHRLAQFVKEQRAILHDKADRVSRLVLDHAMGDIDDSTFYKKMTEIRADGRINLSQESYAKLLKDLNTPATRRLYRQTPKAARAGFIKERNELNGVYRE